MRSLFAFYIIFATVGAIALVLSVFFVQQTLTRASTWVEAPAIITDLGGGDKPNLIFEYQGKSYEFTSSYSDSGMHVGDSTLVYYPAGQPEDAEVKTLLSIWFLPGFTAIFAIIFGGVGLYGIPKQLKRIRAKKELFDNQGGKRLNLPITTITQDMSYKVNGRSPYIIVCQWMNPMTNTMYEFKSDYLWYHPGGALGDRKNLDVYIDENDPSRYYVDTTFLPKKA